MRVRLPLLLAPLALCVPAVVAAQAPPPDASSIVVEGIKDRAKRLQNFVKDLTPSTIFIEARLLSRVSVLAQ